MIIYIRLPLRLSQTIENPHIQFVEHELEWSLDLAKTQFFKEH